MHLAIASVFCTRIAIRFWQALSNEPQKNMKIPLENQNLSFEEYQARLSGQGDRTYIHDIDEHTSSAPSPYSPESVRLHGIVQNYAETHGCTYQQAIATLNISL